MDEMGIIRGLAVSLGLGLVVGMERGWQARSAPEGERVAGLRTFGLIGLAGGICGLLAQELGGALVVVGLALAVAVNSIAQWRRPERLSDAGVTTIFAVFVTYSVGVLAALGHEIAAASGAVATAVLLGLKLRLHRWLAMLDEHEFFAILQILVISVVVLPLLPDRGFGPYGALNPFEIWWMVVLISAISFVGYFLVRILGASRGFEVTAGCGALVSSTAITLSFARLARRQRDLQPLLAAGIVFAAAIMFVRVAVIVAVVRPALLAYAAPSLAAMTVVGFAAALWRRHRTVRPDVPPQSLSNPLDVVPALLFALLLAAVLLLSHWLRDMFGAFGIYGLALASGLGDVDAITLSLSRHAAMQIGPDIAAMGISLAAISNTAAKAVLASVLGGRGMAKLIAWPMLAIVVAGVAALFLPPLVPSGP